jgi:hypothetical protein
VGSDPSRASFKVDFAEAMAMLKDWELRGFARKGKRGWLVTGRALMLREALMEKAGRRPELYD